MPGDTSGHLTGRKNEASHTNRPDTYTQIRQQLVHCFSSLGDCDYGTESDLVLEREEIPVGPMYVTVSAVRPFHCHHVHISSVCWSLEDTVDLTARYVGCE